MCSGPGFGGMAVAFRQFGIPTAVWAYGRLFDKSILRIEFLAIAILALMISGLCFMDNGLCGIDSHCWGQVLGITRTSPVRRMIQSGGVVYIVQCLASFPA